MSLGSFLEASWGVLGASWRSRGLLGASWVPRGSLLGASWGHLGGLLEASWSLLGASWSHFGGDRSTKGGSLISVAPREPQKSPLGPLLERSWSALGRSWGRLGALLGLSWGSLGPTWNRLEASEGHRTQKGEKATNIGCPLMFDVFWPLGGLLWEAPWPLEAVLERSWALLEHLGNHIEPSWAILTHLGGRLGLPEALLEPSWAILDALTARETPPPDPGERG